MSAIKTVIANIKGQNYTLTYNSSTGSYEASITAPTTTSYNENSGHYFPVIIKATDVAGNVTTINDSDATFGSKLRLRVKETTKPVCTFVSPTSGAGLTNNKPTIKIKVTDSGSGIDVNTFQLQIDSGTAIKIASCTKTAITNGYEISYTPVNALTDGSHTITASVSDNDGNKSTVASITIKVDTVPPTLTVSAPTDNSFTNNAKLTVSGNTNDVTSSPVTVSITVGGKDAGSVTVGSDGAFSKEVTLNEGDNVIVITSTDSLGKATSVTRHVTLDTTIPEFTSVTVSPNPVTAGNTFTISVKVSS